MNVYISSLLAIFANRLYGVVVRRGCTAWLYGVVVRRGCTAWLYGVVVRRGCTAWLSCNERLWGYCFTLCYIETSQMFRYWFCTGQSKAGVFLFVKRVARFLLLLSFVFTFKYGFGCSFALSINSGYSSLFDPTQYAASIASMNMCLQ